MTWISGAAIKSAKKKDNHGASAPQRGSSSPQNSQKKIVRSCNVS